MKYGYSLLLEEHIEAAAISDEDCTAFQIVCPLCKEPVFKATRETKAGKAVHCLSHYEKPVSHIAGCEWSVNSLQSGELKKSNTLSRKRKMKYFLSVLDEVVLKNEYQWIPRQLVDQLSQMKKSKSMRHLHKIFRQYLYLAKGIDVRRYIYQFFQNHSHQLTEVFEEFPQTAFAMETQMRIAFDMWKYLQSPIAKGKLDFMFNNSLLYLIFRLNHAKKIRELQEHEKQLLASLLDLMDKSREDGLQIIASMAKYQVPDEHSASMDLLSRMIIDIKYEIFGCLFRVPYFKLLKGDAGVISVKMVQNDCQ
jgi:hypothetical protein